MKSTGLTSETLRVNVNGFRSPAPAPAPKISLIWVDTDCPDVLFGAVGPGPGAGNRNPFTFTRRDCSLGVEILNPNEDHIWKAVLLCWFEGFAFGSLTRQYSTSKRYIPPILEGRSKPHPPSSRSRSHQYRGQALYVLPPRTELTFHRSAPWF